jgi:uncharacterized membrane protein
MRLWLISMVYIVASVACGLTLPRIEHHYLPTVTHDMSASTAQAFLSAAASGMPVLVGIVFSIALSSCSLAPSPIHRVRRYRQSIKSKTCCIGLDDATWSQDIPGTLTASFV